MISKITTTENAYNKITTNPGTIDGLKEKQISKLEKLNLL